MWASCCGLLNEVMGTGTVRAQQPGFGAGAGPFRFAPSAGYSTYPPTSSGSAGQLCKACGLAFSVFRRKVKGGGREEVPEDIKRSYHWSLHPVKYKSYSCTLYDCQLLGFSSCQHFINIFLQTLWTRLSNPSVNS